MVQAARAGSKATVVVTVVAAARAARRESLVACKVELAMVATGAAEVVEGDELVSAEAYLVGTVMVTAAALARAVAA